MQAHLEGGQGLRSLQLNEAEQRELRNYRFVTRLPELLIINIGEDQLTDATAIESEFRERYGAQGVAVATLCAKIEAELSTMEPDEASEFRTELGLTEISPLDRAIGLAYDLLGLQSFLTAGEDECRAWPVAKGSTAPEAAGKIHTDLERGFIRAEVAGYADLVDAGSMAELKKRGQLRTEGKSYVVQDGDVLNILFNV
jgi:ribosome-binding ATPase YchF (GTP1/OBG family)